MDEFLCFPHIPKCGGSTFHEILKRNLGDGYTYVPHGLGEGLLDRARIEDFLTNLPTRSGIGGHRVPADVPYDFPGRDVRCVCFVRDPMARLRSQYFFTRGLPARPATLPATYRALLEQILEAPDSYKMGADAQARWIRLADQEVERRVRTEALFLFPVERFAEACAALELALPSVFRDASFSVRNTRPNPTTPAPEEEALEGEVRRRCMVRDARLYAAAHECLDRHIASHRAADAFGKQLRSLHRRCAIRRAGVDSALWFVVRASRALQRVCLPTPARRAPTPQTEAPRAEAGS